MWQLAHWPATLNWVWFQLLGVQLATPWQLPQPLDPTGMCVAALPVAALPLWQDAQLVDALNALWSTRAPDQVVVERWQLSQLPVTLACTALPGLPTAGGKPPLWQPTQPLPMATLLCTRAELQLPKPALWQLSQLADAVAATVA